MDRGPSPILNRCATAAGSPGGSLYILRKPAFVAELVQVRCQGHSRRRTQMCRHIRPDTVEQLADRAYAPLQGAKQTALALQAMVYVVLKLCMGLPDGRAVTGT